MHINVPEFETSFLAPHKSGSKIVYASLIETLESHTIDYKIIGSNYDTHKNCILFVRNPVNRFFSSYDWYIKMTKQIIDSNQKLSNTEKNVIMESIKPFNDLEITSLSSFIEKYIGFINNSSDTHYLPQSSFFLTKSGDMGTRANLNFNLRKEYDNRFENNNYKFFRIEEIDQIIKINNSFLKDNEFHFGLTKKENLNKFKLKPFTFFNNFPKTFNHMFMVFYTYFKDFYKESHHSQNPNYYYDEITLVEYQTVLRMFKKELDFYGYDEELNYDKNKFKTNFI